MTDSNTQASPFASAYRAYREALVAAPQYVDPRLTDTANGQERAKLVRNARATLAAAIPPEVERTVTRADVFEARTPRTADEVALHGREREKAYAIASAGRPLQEVIASAGEARVAALADDLETAYIRDPQLAPEIEEALFQRLVKLGAQDAVTADAEERNTAATTAWRDTLTEALERGEVSVSNRTAAYYADPEGYEQAFSSADVPVDWSAIERIDRQHPDEATA